MVATIKETDRKVGCIELSAHLKRKNGKEKRRNRFVL